ncbi:uncharacterized protein LOC113065934 [Carassius auratus]|uniref:Uncharacterized protein LOC113065934 n=1 Tax=Carassius auratus TaxID=7957 RepID=A0A6P6M9N1_CARAU|nr:uncharacterized protein LOC113065934 [Carassius auratus]
MEEYIKEVLAQGYIRTSTSSAASSFFFVEKKDGGLRPCIDYQALNNLTVKFRYPLPLVPAALEHLRGATMFTKLDLQCLRAFQLYLKAEKCSFHQPSVQFLGYNISSSGIRMDEGKVNAIRDWPTPTTIKELQRFLCFANFYGRFIQNFSTTGVGAVHFQQQGIPVASTHAPSSPGNSTRQRSTMISATGNCWPSSWPWKNGGFGWRDPNTPFWSSQIIRTCSIFEWPKD